MMQSPNEDALIEPLREAEVSIGPDGRLYFHDLDCELIELALAINPADQAMRRRLALCDHPTGKEPA